MKKISCYFISLIFVSSLSAQTIYLTSHTPIYGVKTKTTVKSRCDKITISGHNLGNDKSSNGATDFINFLDRTGLSNIAVIGATRQFNNSADVILGSVIARQVVKETDSPSSQKTVPQERCYEVTEVENATTIVGYNNCGVSGGKKICVESKMPTYTLELK